MGIQQAAPIHSEAGRTLAINPGSDYETGILNGVLVTLEPQKRD